MKALGYLFSGAVMFGLSICIMQFGWGLKPVSWGWIIWGGIGSILVGAIIQTCADADR